MKNTVKNIISLLTFLIILIIGQSIVLMTKANPELPDTDITIYSPQDNKNYDSDFHLLNFSISAINDYNNGTRQAWYNLDGQGDISVSIECETIDSIMGHPYSWFWGITDLPQLSFGKHSIKVSIKYDFGDFILTDSNTVTFNVQNSTNSTIPKPSIPEFTVKLLSSQTENTSTIQITIKNQPFIPYYDANSGRNISLYYIIRAKEHTEQNWTNLYFIEDMPIQSNSDYTNLSFPLLDESTNSYILGDKMWKLSFGVQIDFQEEAMIGYIHRIQGNFAPYYFAGETSDWSNIQTVTIPSTSTESTSIWLTWELEIIVGIVIVIVLVFSVILIYLKKHKHEDN